MTPKEIIEDLHAIEPIKLYKARKLKERWGCCEPPRPSVAVGVTGDNY